MSNICHQQKHSLFRKASLVQGQHIVNFRFKPLVRHVCGTASTEKTAIILSFCSFPHPCLRLQYTFFMPSTGMWITWFTDTMETVWNALKNILVFTCDFTKLYWLFPPLNSWQNVCCFMILRSRATGWQREEDDKNGCHISGSPYICHKTTTTATEAMSVPLVLF